MSNRSFIHTARRLTQIGFLVLIFVLPIFDVLRYDVAAKELYLFGNVWTLGLKEGFYLDNGLRSATHVAVQFFLKAILPWIVVLSVFPLLGFLFGRFFCGWLCPEGALFELAEYLNLKVLGRRSLYKSRSNDPDGAQDKKAVFGVFAFILLIIIPPVTGVFLSGYFIAPKTIYQQITTLHPGPGLTSGIIGVSIYMVVTSMLVRHTFCRYVCAPGLMQMLFGWISPLSLRIRFDRRDFTRCTDCKACEKVCFMNVKPRLPRKDINCVNCGECIIACRKELGVTQGLFSYGLGKNAEEEIINGSREGRKVVPKIDYKSTNILNT